MSRARGRRAAWGRQLVALFAAPPVLTRGPWQEPGDCSRRRVVILFKERPAQLGVNKAR